MIEPGVVIGVDRDYVDVNGTRTGQLRALLQSGVEVEATYAGVPPWPLSTALFDGPGEWFCLGPIGDRRLVVHDDFMFLGTSSIGDTEWIEGGGGSTGVVSDPAEGAGVLRLTAPSAAAVQWIRKRDRMVTLTSGDAWWLSARVRTSGAAGNFAVVGLGDANVVAAGSSASTDAGAFITAAVGAATLSATAGTSSTATSIPEGPALTEWLWVDLVVMGGEWVAGWVNGSGPWVVETDVPGTSQRSVTPFVRCLAGADSGLVDVDCVSLSRVSPVQVPDGVGVPAVPVL